jgi:anti-sigma B factor antagonist
MSLTLTTRQNDRHIILEASGRLVAGESCTQLRDLVKHFTADGAHSFVLNLAGISYMDSSGLGLLLSIYSTIRGQGGNVTLVSIGDRVKELLTMTKLTEVFEIFEDETAELTAEKRRVVSEPP